MERVDRKIAEAENMLVYLASDDSLPTKLREDLVEVAKTTLHARNQLKVLMLRGVDYAG